MAHPLSFGAHAAPETAEPSHRTPRSRVGAMEQHVLDLQRAAGNRATAETIAGMVPVVPVQRCGGEVHDGCACADAPTKAP